MEFSTVRTLRAVLLGGCLALSLLGRLFANVSTVVSAVCVIAALIMFLAHAVICLLFWRCPSCGRHLHHKNLWPRYCSYCGEYLE